MSETWERIPVLREKPGFYVEVYIEGYRPSKDTWLHQTESFDALEEAQAYYDKLVTATHKEREEMLDFNSYKGTGWYGFSFERAEVYEETAGGSRYHWVRNYKPG